MDEPAEKAVVDPAFRSAVISAWIDNRMTRDKTLLALSSGGIGVLLTLVSTVGVESAVELIAFFLAFTGFLLTILSVIANFCYNPRHLKMVLKDPSAKDRLLVWLDRLAISGFTLAILAAGFIGFANGLSEFGQIGVEHE